MGLVLRALDFRGHCCGAAAGEDPEPNRKRCHFGRQRAASALAAAGAVGVDGLAGDIAENVFGDQKRRQTRRRLGLLRLSLPGVRKDVHQELQMQPRRLHSACAAACLLQAVRALGDDLRKRVDQTISAGEFRIGCLLRPELNELSENVQGRVDCIRSASSEALNWAKAMCQGEGADVSLEGDRDDDGADRKVKFKIYSVKSSLNIFVRDAFD